MVNLLHDVAANQFRKDIHMMQENVTEVALEFSDHIRAARQAGKCHSPDLDGLLRRLERANGATEIDALALLAYGQAIIVSMAGPVLIDEERIALAQTSLTFVRKASAILENITGRMSDEFV